eukprot:scaffold648223_cov43-Prasinocladus_malaysianus.AAC.1
MPRTHPMCSPLNRCQFCACFLNGNLIAECAPVCIGCSMQEKIFNDAKRDLKRDLDLFVVNSTGSIFQ